MKIKRPRNLITYRLFRKKDEKSFRPCDDCCALGYLGYKVLGPSAKHMNGWPMADAIRDKLGTIIANSDFEDLVYLNNTAKTNAERVERFVGWCVDHGIEVV